jgi:PAS domain S-box-containing protein
LRIEEGKAKRSERGVTEEGRMVREDPCSERLHDVSTARVAVIEAMTEGLVILDNDGCVLDINPAARELIGKPRVEIVGRNVERVFSGWPSVIGLVEAAGRDRVEIVMESGDQEQVFEVRSMPLYEEKTRGDRFLLLRDIRERKRTEKALRQAKRAAEVADQAKSEFMSVASHEMRTPITSIKGYTDLLSRETVGPINETQARFLDTIRTNADRIALLISDLSDIARIESGRLRVETGRVDVTEVVREAVGDLQRQIDEREQTVKLDISDDLPPVRADHQRVVQVLSNLVSNANKFTPVGGRITVRAESRLGETGPREVLIQVEDTGIGIRADEQDRVFEKFYRSEDRAATDMPGSGLGLSIAASLVELQEGEIWLESEFREGTTVTFTLPVSEGMLER